MARVNEERKAPKVEDCAAKRETADDSPKTCGLLEFIRAFAIWQDLLAQRYWQGALAGGIVSIIISTLILFAMWREVDRTVIEWCGGR